ncbi:hypothetical protein [Halospeciosus flavus]|uniref:hypothetical protein n=1 Tax=Halospeciosus flavus TaxID=3032283 RepID=UPI00360980EB
MSATLFLDEPLDDRQRIDCEEVRILGNVAWATVSDEEVVVPLSNVAGIEGETVDQRVDELDSPGGDTPNSSPTSRRLRSVANEGLSVELRPLRPGYDYARNDGVR